MCVFGRGRGGGGSEFWMIYLFIYFAWISDISNVFQIFIYIRVVVRQQPMELKFETLVRIGACVRMCARHDDVMM